MGFKRFLFIVSAIFLSVSSCKNIPVKEKIEKSKASNIPKSYSPQKPKQLTFVGSNQRARFSPDGESIVFLSKDRTRHKKQQIYILNLKSKKERRVSYHDGDDLSVDFSKDGKTIVFSSTTDEIKENPKSQSKFPGSEIYVSDLFGREIKRKTFEPQYDSEATFNPQSQAILFVSLIKDATELMLLYPKAKKAQRISESKSIKTSPQVSPNGKWILWSEKKPAFDEYDLIIADSNGKKIKDLLTSESGKITASWHPTENLVLISAQLPYDRNTELYTLSTDGKCIKRLTYSSASEKNPVFSPDGSRIIFDSDENMGSQIYILDYLAPTTCLK